MGGPQQLAVCLVLHQGRAPLLALLLPCGPGGMPQLPAQGMASQASTTSHAEAGTTTCYMHPTPSTGQVHAHASLLLLQA
jgi:hypothetical protein